MSGGLSDTWTARESLTVTTLVRSTALPVLGEWWGALMKTEGDFVGETDNGTDDIWWIVEGQDYPRLWWERGGDPSL